MRQRVHRRTPDFPPRHAAFSRGATAPPGVSTRVPELNVVGKKLR
jgi:hypothetical protein